MNTISIFNKEELFERYMNEKEVIKEVIDIFLKSTIEKIDLLKDAIEIKDYEKIKFNAYSIKGQAYNMSAKQLGDIALKIEINAKNYDIDQISENFIALKDAFLKIKDILLKIEI